MEREANINVIQPTNAQQVERMTEVLRKTYNHSNATPEEKQAFALWQFQVSQGTAADEVKLEFLRGFYFWLLGRGDEADHEKTMWGRANAAVYNKEVASYIDQFVSKRTRYAMLLQLLSMRVPSTLNGYYLYYKYIVKGALKRVKGKDGLEYWDMSNEDYLQDFDIFRQELDKEGILGERGEDAYSMAIAPQGNKPRDRKGFEASVPYPVTREGLERGDAKRDAFSLEKSEQKLEAVIEAQTPSATKHVRHVADETNAEPATEDERRDTIGDKIIPGAVTGQGGESQVAKVLDMSSDISSITLETESGDLDTPQKLPPKEKEEMEDSNIASMSVEEAQADLSQLAEAVEAIIKEGREILTVEDHETRKEYAANWLELVDSYRDRILAHRTVGAKNLSEKGKSFLREMDRALTNLGGDLWEAQVSALEAKLDSLLESTMAEEGSSLMQEESTLDRIHIPRSPGKRELRRVEKQLDSRTHDSSASADPGGEVIHSSSERSAEPSASDLSFVSSDKSVGPVSQSSDDTGTMTEESGAELPSAQSMDDSASYVEPKKVQKKKRDSKGRYSK